MDEVRLDNVNIAGCDPLPSPAEIKAELPLTAAAAATVRRSRSAVCGILDGVDDRLLVVVGPCSIHDVGAALEYAQRLRSLADDVGDALLLVMRIYFEKPRTSVGWKGLINDPDMDGTFRIAEGLRTARRLLLDVAELGIPAAHETLDPITPQYLADLMTWAAIGARTTESQRHRELASGLSMPVGFKNSTDGSIKAAIHALTAVSAGHSFVGIDNDGHAAVFRTRGNAYGHLVLRGGDKSRNYDPVSIAEYERDLAAGGLAGNIMVDCSHGNSAKNPDFQEPVLRSCVEQIRSGNRSLIGVMIESNLAGGKQPMGPREQLRHGVSVTDACIDWETTERVLRDAAERLRPVLSQRDRQSFLKR